MKSVLRIAGVLLLTMACSSSLAENPLLNARWPQAQDAPMSNPKMALGDGVAYVADAVYGFRVVNVSAAGSPSVVAGFRVAWTPGSIAVAGQVAAVAEADGTKIHLIDLTTMRIASVYEEPDGLSAMGVGPGVLALGTAMGEVAFVDIAAPAAPALKSVFESIGPVGGIEFSGGRIFVMSIGEGIDVLEASQLEAPTRVATYFRPQLKGAAVSGDFLFAHIAARNEEEQIALGVERWDVSDPGRPVFAGAFYPWDAARIESFSASGALALVSGVGGTEYRRFYVVADFSEGGFATVAGTFDRAGLIKDGRIYAATENEFVVGEKVAPGVFGVAGAMRAQARARAMAFAGERMFVLEAEGMTRVIDGGNLATLSQTALGEEALSVVTDGARAYVRTQSGEVVALDEEGRFAASFELPLGRIFAEGNRAYVLRDDTASLEVYDLGDPWFPVLLGRAALRQLASDAILRDGILFVAEGDGGVEIVDARDASAPASVAQLDIANATACALAGNFLFVAEDGAAVRAVDVSVPERPAIVGGAAVEAPIFQMAANGTILYARAEGGVLCLEISDPARPVLIARGETAVEALAAGAGAVWALRGDGSIATVELEAVFAAPILREGEIEVRWFGPGMRLEYRDDGMAGWMEVPGCEHTNCTRMPMDGVARIFRLARP